MIKHLLYTSLAVVALALPSQALEQRTFYDSGKTKSFEATLTGYEPMKNIVTVVNEKGKTVKFPLKVISEECQKYVLSKQDLLTISKSVRLKFKEVKEDAGDEAKNVGYAIEVYNRSKNTIEDVTLNYTLYYRVGDLTKGGTVGMTKTGTVSTGKIYNHDTLTVNTDKVEIIRKIKPPEGGG